LADEQPAGEITAQLEAIGDDDEPPSDVGDGQLGSTGSQGDGEALAEVEAEQAAPGARPDLEVEHAAEAAGERAATGAAAVAANGVAGAGVAEGGQIERLVGLPFVGGSEGEWAGAVPRRHRVLRLRGAVIRVLGTGLRLQMVPRARRAVSRRQPVLRLH